jgi:hypothetical protein
VRAGCDVVELGVEVVQEPAEGLGVGSSGTADTSSVAIALRARGLLGRGGCDARGRERLLTLEVVLDARDLAAFDREDVVDLAAAIDIVDRELSSVGAQHDVAVAAEQLERVDLLICVVCRHEGRYDLVGSVAYEARADALPDHAGVEGGGHRLGVAAAQGVEPAPEEFDVVALHSALPSWCYRRCETPAGRRSGTAAEPLRRGWRAEPIDAQLADNGERRGGA